MRPKSSVRNFSVSASTFLAAKKEGPKTNEKSIMVLKPTIDHHDLHAGHYERNFITATRAMQDFLLKPEHLVSLRVTTRRSPNENAPSVKVYWRKDIEAKSIQIWGSLEAMEHEKEKVLERNPEGDIEIGSFFKRIVNKKRERRNWQSRQQQQSNQRMVSETKGALQSESGQVVVTAICINAANFVAKGVAWISTGSHAMFSEMVHSAADTLNQVREMCSFFVDLTSDILCL